MHKSRPMLALAAVVAALSGCGGDDGQAPSATPAPPTVAVVRSTVQKVASCSSGSVPESGLQGQVPISVRATGFNGYNCNLSVVGQYVGEGGEWSQAGYKDAAGHTCAYHATAFPRTYAGQTIARVNPGVPVIDISNPAQPVRTTSLNTAAMMDPWESLRVSPARGLLVAGNAAFGGLVPGVAGPEVDVYDISRDCTAPQLLSSVPVGTGLDGGVLSTAAGNPPKGHEGAMSPDGLTYYIGDAATNSYRAIDISDPTHPKMVAEFDMRTNTTGGTAHGVSVSKDGNRIYVASVGQPTPAEVVNPAAPIHNGFLILDTSQVQARTRGATIRQVAAVVYKDGSIAQTSTPVTINGKPYLIVTDEGGSQGLYADANAGAQTACSQNLSPFPMGRIYDISNETSPVLVAKLGLEIHDVANCSRVLPDLVGAGYITYGSHYCSVDNRDNATALECSYFNSGIRVFDIRDPTNVKEIAYLNPAASRNTNLPGSVLGGGSADGSKLDFCATHADFDYAKQQLTTMCMNSGLLVMKFAPGVWPMVQSTPSVYQE